MKTEFELELEEIQAKIDRHNSGGPNWELIATIFLVVVLDGLIIYFAF